MLRWRLFFKFFCLPALATDMRVPVHLQVDPTAYTIAVVSFEDLLLDLLFVVNKCHTMSANTE